MRACTSKFFIYRHFAFAVSIAYGLVAVLGSPCVSAQSTLTSVTADHTIANAVERMELIVKSSRILSLGDRIPRFQVHNEEILGATPVSENQIQIFAKNPGTTQVNLWDTNDKLYTVDVTIVADARAVEGILNSQLPLASLKVMPINDGSAIVSGFVTSVDDVDRAVMILEQFYKVVINNIQVVGVQQVLLHTRIMEVSRTKLRQLGVDWALGNSNYRVLNGPGQLLNVPGVINGELPFALPSTNGFININDNFEAFIAALDEQKLVKLLAEPTVVATHGRPARFIVGGRVPTLVPSGIGSTQVQYEDYGTSIDFLPFVIGPGRIRLEVRPEVSELDPSHALVSAGTNVMAFTSRYVETAVEMQAGQTLAIAGLLQSRVESTIRRTPVLGHIPLIGTFFRHARDQRNEIELLIMVTPELVDAMDPHEVPRGGPGLNSDLPDDYEFYHNGHIEVPNLKTDQCHEEGAACGPSDASFQPGGMIQGDVIINDGFSQNTKSPAHSQTPSSRSTQAVASQRMPQQIPAPKSNWNGPNLIEPSAASVATAPQRNAPQGNVPASYNRSRRTSKFESGTLLPATAITPSSTPNNVGNGVSVMDSGSY